MGLKLSIYTELCGEDDENDEDGCSSSKKTLLSDKDEDKREEKRIHPGHRETPANKEEETKDGRCNLMDPLE